MRLNLADVYKVTNCYSLNVRNKPSMSGKPIKWYQKGDEVRVYKTSGNWCNTSDTKEWWVYNKYITKIASPAPQPTPEPAPVTTDITPPAKENTETVT